MKNFHQLSLISISEQEYHTFAQNHPCSNFLNSIYAGRKMQKNGWNIDYLALKDNSDIYAAVMLASRSIHVGNYFYAPRGFLLDFNNEELLSVFVNQLKTYMSKHKGVYFKMDPYVVYQVRDKNGAIQEHQSNNDKIVASLKNLGFHHNGFDIGYSETSQCRWMSVLDLRNKTKEQILKEMNSQTRQNIKNTIKNGIKIRLLEKNELHILDKIVDVTSERHGFSNLSLEYYEDQYDIFKEHACAYYAYLDLDDYIDTIQKERKKEEETIANAEEVLKENPHSKNSRSRINSATQHLESLAKREKDYHELKKDFDHEVPLAASMFVKYGHEIIYLTSGSYDQYKRFKGPYALQWHMIQMAMQENYDFYNFYGISGYFEKDQEGYGVFDFKRGFNADVVELIGDFELPVSKLRYTCYKLLKKLR